MPTFRPRRLVDDSHDFKWRQPAEAPIFVMVAPSIGRDDTKATPHHDGDATGLRGSCTPYISLNSRGSTSVIHGTRMITTRPTPSTATNGSIARDARSTERSAMPQAMK